MNMLTLQAGWLTDLTNWLFGILAAIFSALMSFLTDLLIQGVENVLFVFAIAIEAMPVPEFIQQYSLDALLSQGGPTIVWLVGTFRIPECMAILAAGVAFNLLRKLLTLGQW